jgi:hypothetical protein
MIYFCRIVQVVMVAFARNNARNTTPFLLETKHINGFHIQVNTTVKAFCPFHHTDSFASVACDS